MKTALPAVPWQVTGNHWLTLPCIHPGDASIHAIGAVHAGTRGAVEFAGDADFASGAGRPLFRLVIEVNGECVFPAAEGIAWERESGWIPGFSCRARDMGIRGTICAPHGRGQDTAGVVIAVAVENRGAVDVEAAIGLEGHLGHRQLRVRTPRACTDGHVVRQVADEFIVLGGDDAGGPMALAVGAEGDAAVSANADDCTWAIRQSVTLRAGETREFFFHAGAATEPDGAVAAVRVMRRRTGAALISGTRTALRTMEPATGNSAADRLIARHAFFSYFCSLARSLDGSHWHVIRSRVPWNGRGLTITDWEALMWVLPAVQLIDHALAREVLLRVCELHGYSPGGGVRYLDGSIFEAGFSLEGAAAYPLAVDDYIVQTSDDRIVEEPALADTMYLSHEDIEARRHPQLPLYSTEVHPDGTQPAHPYTAHGNAVVALALEVLAHKLDEKTAEKVQEGAAVRAALLRQFADASEGKPVLAASTDLDGKKSHEDAPSASLYWLPYHDLMSRDDSTYRRTVKRIETANTDAMVVRCAQLLGPSRREALEWLRRAPLDGGLAAEYVDVEGRGTANGGDAALSGLIAHSVWYAVSAVGVS